MTALNLAQRAFQWGVWVGVNIDYCWDVTPDGGWEGCCWWLHCDDSQLRDPDVAPEHVPLHVTTYDHDGNELETRTFKCPEEASAYVRDIEEGCVCS